MQNKKNILLLIDGQGWVLDRIAFGIEERLKHKYNFTLIPYATINEFTYFNIIGAYDLVHYQNWNITIPEALRATKIPVIISIKSHRYPDSFVEYVNNNRHLELIAITPQIQEKFSESVYIPDPLFDGYEPSRKFTVGIAYQNEPNNIEYKGVKLVREACNELGCELSEANGNIKPEDMRKWYESIDLYVCASENEAMNTPVMECLAMNKPVITTNVGIPALLNVNKCDRSIKSIKNAIGKFYTSPQVLKYKWGKHIEKLDKLYSKLL